MSCDKFRGRSPVESQPDRRATVLLFDYGHVDGVVREQDFADVAEQDVHSLFAVDFLVAVHRAASSLRCGGEHAIFGFLDLATRTRDEELNCRCVFCAD